MQAQVRGSCQNMSKASYLGEMPLLTSAYFIALPSNALLIANISAAIAYLVAQPSYTRVVDDFLAVRQTCVSTASSTDAVSANSMIGLFIVVAAFMISGVFISLTQAYFRKPARATQLQKLHHQQTGPSPTKETPKPEESKNQLSEAPKDTAVQSFSTLESYEDICL